jgi:hypothetical protein
MFNTIKAWLKVMQYSGYAHRLAIQDFYHLLNGGQPSREIIPEDIFGSELLDLLGISKVRAVSINLEIKAKEIPTISVVYLVNAKQAQEIKYLIERKNLTAGWGIENDRN